VYRHHAPHVKTVFRQRSSLVEAEIVHGATEVDAAWTDAEDVLPPQPFLCKHDSNSHCSGQRWRHDDRYQIQRATNYQTGVTASVNLQTTI